MFILCGDKKEVVVVMIWMLCEGGGSHWLSYQLYTWLTAGYHCTVILSRIVILPVIPSPLNTSHNPKWQETCKVLMMAGTVRGMYWNLKSSFLGYMVSPFQLKITFCSWCHSKVTTKIENNEHCSPLIALLDYLVINPLCTVVKIGL